jgi:hypothetical protein
VADRSKLDSNFISLVLSVSGRVRPIDLHAIPEADRATALQSYYQANAAATPLHFEGEDLVKGPGAGSAPVPVTGPQPAAVADLPAEPFVSDYGPATDVAAPAAEFAPAADAIGAADPAAPAPDAPAPPDGDFFAIPPTAPPTDVPNAEWTPDVPVGEPQFPADKVSFLWWLLPVFFTWLGGLIAFLLLRKKNPKAAKTMLITGIVLTVVFALAGVAAVVGLGLFAVPGLL